MSPAASKMATVLAHTREAPPPTSSSSLSPPNPPAAATVSPGKHLQCTLCLREFRDARILPCFHSFCASCLDTSCLQKAAASGPKGSGTTATIYCPICMDESVAPRNGVEGLARNLYVQNLQDLRSALPGTSAPSPLLPRCDLCTDNEPATSRCEVCACHLCNFCDRAHQRQGNTAEHPLVPVGLHTALPRQQQGGGGLSESCELHPREQLNLFCESCEVAICNECTMEEEHGAHTFLPLADVTAQYADVVQSLLAQTSPLVESLNGATKNIEFLLSGVQDRVESVAEEICDVIDARMRALQEHKRSLLNQLDAIKRHKENTLELQLDGLGALLDDVNSKRSTASHALRNGGGGTFRLLSLKGPLIADLQNVVNAKYEFHPQEDDYIRFRSRSPAGQCGGFDVFGTLDTRGPSAAHSLVEGEGLFDAWQRRTSHFRVAVHDRYGERRLVGGDNVEARIHNRSRVVVKATVADGDDGTYRVSYMPESVGEHRLAVLINGKHVRASPFVVNVRPRKKHQGVFHCCTFCSSEGKKHVRCGCGGTVPGGYSGCGHGHPGHPGCRHWSCCGSTIEKSDCLL